MITRVNCLYNFPSVFDEVGVPFMLLEALPGLPAQPVPTSFSAGLVCNHIKIRRCVSGGLIAHLFMHIPNHLTLLIA